MSKFDPERDGWGLSEAIMRTAHRGMLAALHRNIIDATGLTYEAIEWWIYRLAPPAAPPRHPPRPIDNLFMLHQESGRRWLIMQGSIETDFLHKLYSAELPCWGRVESSLAPYVRAPAGAITEIESWWKGGGILRLESGERLYAARVEPVRSREAVSASPANVERWYREYVQSGAQISERMELIAAEKHFGRMISRESFREMRRCVLKELRPELQDGSSPDRLRTGRRRG
jgi:hypothetical protein